MIRVCVGIVVLCLYAHANTFRLSTKVVDQELIPVIQINGDTVMEISTAGSKNTFSSSFQRSEKIYNAFQFLKKNKSRLSRIRIRRIDSDYVAYVDNIELYRVTPADVVGTQLTPYQLATEWRKNIREALNKQSPQTYDADLLVDTQQDTSIGLLSFFLTITNSRSFITGVQLLVFIFIQLAVVWMSFRFFSQRVQRILQGHQKRIKIQQNELQRQKNAINNLENQLVERQNAVTQSAKAQ